MIYLKNIIFFNNASVVQYSDIYNNDYGNSLIFDVNGNFSSARVYIQGKTSINSQWYNIATLSLSNNFINTSISSSGIYVSNIIGVKYIRLNITEISGVISIFGRITTSHVATPSSGGAPGRDGVDGKDGTVWYTGNKITGESTTPQIFETGIAYANSGDMYLNTQTSSVYICDAPGVESTATWYYSCNIKGNSAPQIDDSAISAANPWSSKQIVDTLAPAFEVSGPVVTCNPVDGYPLHVVSQIVPVQEGEGDPSPENVRPISGWDEADLWVGGANLFNPDNLSGGQLTELDGVPVYQFRDGATGNFMFPVPNIKNQQFTLRLKLAGTATKDFNFGLYYSDGSFDLKNIGNGLGPYTITSSAGKTLTSIQSINGWNVIRYIDLSQTMLVVGLSVPADFSSYRGQTIALPFGQTVYGGMLDWTTGVLTVDWAKYVATGQENVKLGQTFQTNCRWYFEPSLPTLGNLNQRNIQCNILTTIASGSTDEMGCVCTGTNLISILLPKDTVPNVSAVKEWIQTNQPEFVYQTSQVENVQLTPQEILALSGTNTIYTDTGDTTVSGRADPNAVINNLAQRIAALESAATGI